jgi:hypothetical protein
MAPGGQVIAGNNVFLTNGTSPGIAGIYGNAGGNDVGDIWVNNLHLGNATNDNSTVAAFSGITNLTLANNAIGNGSFLIAQGGGSNPVFSLVDNNYYQGCTGYNCYFLTGIDSGSFATWQASSVCGSNGCDLHGNASLNSTTYFALNTPCVGGSVGQSCAPKSTSPLVNNGHNFYTQFGCASPTNIGFQYLCKDINGVARPSSGQWYVGPYQTIAGAAGSVTVSPKSQLIGHLVYRQRRWQQKSFPPQNDSCNDTCLFLRPMVPLLFRTGRGWAKGQRASLRTSRQSSLSRDKISSATKS